MDPMGLDVIFHMQLPCNAEVLGSIDRSRILHHRFGGPKARRETLMTWVDDSCTPWKELGEVKTYTPSN